MASSPLTEALLASGNPALIGLLPKTNLAQSLIEQGSSSAPASSLQALARIAQSYAGHHILDQTTDAIGQNMTGQTNAMATAFGAPPITPTQAPVQTGGIGNFVRGLLSSDPNVTPSGAPSPQPESGPSPMVQAMTGQPAASSAAPQSANLTVPSSAASSMPQSALGSMANAGAGQPTAFSSLHDTAMKLINTPYPALRQRGLEMLQQQAEALSSGEAEAHGKMLVAGQNYDPVTGAVTGVNGFNPTIAATKQAEATGSELGKVAPNVVQAQIGATNATNLGTMGTDAQKAGLMSNATAMGQNAPNVANAEAANTGLVTDAKNASDLAYAAPLTNARDTAAATVKLATQPLIDTATTTAVNQANAGKPLTPEQINSQEQAASQDFSNNELVKRHGEAAQAYLNVQKAAQDPTKAGDMGMVDSLVKMFNPAATVRQGTFDNFMEHSQGIPSNVVGIVKSFYSNEAHLQPETRQQLLNEATNYMASSRQAYNGVASFARQQAAAHGLNPNNVVRPILDPLTAQEELARRAAAAAGAGQ